MNDKLDNIDFDAFTLDDFDGEFEDSINMLKEYSCPEPSRSETMLLYEKVKIYMQKDITASRLRGFSGILGFAGSQIKILQPYLWVTSIIIICLGVFCLITEEFNSLKYILFMPPMIISGFLLYSLRLNEKGLMEMELSCIYSPLDMLLARLTLVIAYDVIAGIVIFLMAGSNIWRLGVLKLLLAWLIPLLFSAAVTLLSVVALGYMKGAIVSNCLWVILLIFDEMLGSFAVFLNPLDSAFLMNRTIILLISLCIFFALYKLSKKKSYFEYKVW